MDGRTDGVDEANRIRKVHGSSFVVLVASEVEEK